MRQCLRLAENLEELIDVTDVGYGESSDVSSYKLERLMKKTLKNVAVFNIYNSPFFDRDKIDLYIDEAYKRLNREMNWNPNSFNK